MLPLSTAKPLAQALARRGLEMEKRFGYLLPMREREGLQTSTEPATGSSSAGLPDSVFRDLFEYAIGETGRDGLAVEMRESLPIGVFGPLDYLASAAASVAEGTLFVCQHFESIAGETELYVEDAGAQGVRVCVRNGKWFEGFELSDELTLSLVAGRFCELALEAVWPVEVQLSRPKPCSDDPWLAAFGSARLRYGQATASITYTRDAWHTPLRSAVPLLAQLLDSQLHSTSDQTRIVREARGAIRALLRDGAAQILVAQRLGVSARTLQRGLAEAGLTFRELQADVRTLEAARYLRDSTLRIQDVADRLGFYELASFSRAFRGWTGMSPTAYRKELHRKVLV